MSNASASVRSYDRVGPGRWLLPIILAGCTVTPAVPVATGPVSTDCAGLAGLALPGAVVLSAEPVAAGRFKAEDIKGKPELPGFCRVVGSARPSSDSDIRFEVWLPETGWNGRLWGVGNGNFAGSISQRALANRMAIGYAAVATDTGHEADSMNTAWASGHPEKIVDIGHRGVHEAVVNAKRIVAAFYGRKPSRAYFGSCSNGGREALMEAQRYPDDYDGIIAGASAGDWTHLFLGHAQIQYKFAARGGRLIMYHGWNDAVIPAQSSIDYYRQIRGVMGEAGANAAVRLFMAPGVEHCNGGPGPNSFRQISAGGGDPDASLGAALQRWVEQEIAPERIVATKLSNDDDPGSEVVRTRPLCAWPLVARYRGQGNAAVASSFDCGPLP